MDGNTKRPVANKKHTNYMECVALSHLNLFIGGCFPVPDTTPSETASRCWRVTYVSAA